MIACFCSESITILVSVFAIFYRRPNRIRNTSVQIRRHAPGQLRPAVQGAAPCLSDSDCQRKTPKVFYIYSDACKLFECVGIQFRNRIQSLQFFRRKETLLIGISFFIGCV